MVKFFQGDVADVTAWANHPDTGKVLMIAVASNGHIVAMADDGKAAEKPNSQPKG